MPQSERIALVTGASRGIGAETARQLARTAGTTVVINYRQKAPRADKVSAEIAAAGGRAETAQADITDPAAVSAMLTTVIERHARIDLLVLNASGGMERGAADDYALRLNRDAQVDLVRAATPHMPRGSRIVFLTSHQAHFHGRTESIAAYEGVAASKNAGERALRNLIPELADAGITLVIVSGDMIDGTITVRLLDRAHPGVVGARIDEVGTLPTIPEFATAVVAACTDQHESGDIVYVGGADYLARTDDRRVIVEARGEGRDAP